MKKEELKKEIERIEEIVRRLLKSIKKEKLNANCYHADFYKK
jgi:hypothetical protein